MTECEYWRQLAEAAIAVIDNWTLMNAYLPGHEKDKKHNEELMERFKALRSQSLRQ